MALPKVFPPACWVTVTVFAATPVPVIVIVADLGLAPVLAELTVAVIVPSFVPDTGATSSQLASSVILQVVFDVMLNVPLNPDADPSEILVGDTVRNAADSV